MVFSLRRTAASCALGAVLFANVVYAQQARPRGGNRRPAAASAGFAAAERNVRAHMEFLADDALQGRGSGTQYEHIAGLYAAAQLRQFGVAPAGDAGADGKKSYLQKIPLAGGERHTWNVVGELRGGDPRAAQEVVVLSAHMDHLGVKQSGAGDDIYNGADDDASGVTAVLELARALGGGVKPRRTVYFVLFGSEEAGGAGSKYFIDHLPFPLENVAANLQFEMIGRPDAKVPINYLWLTGHERSNLGPALARRGAPLLPDPHPEQQFFRRSDNYALARRGVVAHTVSSFGLHAQYHKPDDDLAHIDHGHLTRSIRAMVGPVRWLVNSKFRPAWNPGQKP